MLRNLLVNWMVLVPLIATAAMLPRMYLGVLGLPSQPELVSRADARLVVPPRLDSSSASVRHRRDCTPPSSFPASGNRAAGSGASPVVPGAGRCWRYRHLRPPLLGVAIREAASRSATAWSSAMPAWSFRGSSAGSSARAGGGRGRGSPRPLPAPSGARRSGWPTTFSRSSRDTIRRSSWSVDVPLRSCCCSLQMTLFVGLASRDMTDDDREWWARAAAWMLMVAVVWLVAERARDLRARPAVQGVLGGGLLRRGRPALAGAAHAGDWRRRRADWIVVDARFDAKRGVERWLFVLAAPVLVLLLIVLLGRPTSGCCEFFHDLDLFQRATQHPIGASLPEDLLALGLLLPARRHPRPADFGQRLLAPRNVSQRGSRGRSSATSRPPEARHPNPFTGFDDEDDLAIHEHRGSRAPAARRQRDPEPGRATIAGRAERKRRVVHDDRAARGSRGLVTGRRMTYAGGISLGRRSRLSGAAVSSNMGAERVEAGADVPADALQRAPGRVARRIPGRPATAIWLRPRAVVRRRAAPERADGKDHRHQPVRATCRTAGTSRTSASTRWCGAGAA